ATSWQYLGSGHRTFEVTLRPGVRFSDGEPLTASAVKTWMNYILTSKGPWAASIPIKSIQTVGTSKVILHLKSPNPVVHYQLTEAFGYGAVGCPKGVANPSSLATQTCGAGQYVSVPSKSELGDHYVFTPNPYYYDPAAVRFSEVDVKIIAQPS